MSISPKESALEFELLNENVPSRTCEMNVGGSDGTFGSDSWYNQRETYRPDESQGEGLVGSKWSTEGKLQGREEVQETKGTAHPTASTHQRSRTWAGNSHHYRAHL